MCGKFTKGHPSWNKGKKCPELDTWSGKQHTKQTLQKMSKVKIGKKNPFFGRKHTDEWKQKMSIGRSGANHINYGKHLSEKTIDKIRKARAKQVFLFPTTIEKIIENNLLKMKIKFKKHKLFEIRDFTHQVDFFIKPNIIIECDGDYWHSRLLYSNREYSPINRDYIIDAELERQGYNVIRLWEYDIKNNLKWCISLILAQLK